MPNTPVIPTHQVQPNGAVTHDQLGIHDRAFTLFQISGLLRSAIGKDISLATLQHEFNIDASLSGWSSLTVSYCTMRSLFERLWLSHNKPRAELLLNHAAQSHYTRFGAISLAALTLDHSEESIRFCARHFRTAWSAVPENNHKGQFSLLHLPKFYDPELRTTLEHFHFVNCFAVSRSHSPGIPVADRVRFTGTCGITKSTLERYFGCPVLFDEGIAQIDFSHQWLNRPRPALAMTLAAQPEQQVKRLQNDIRRDKPSLRQFLTMHLDNIHSADEMAAHLGVSRRTLARRLEREGVSYSILSREVRLTEARRMLRNGVIMADIAEKLGFSDERSFRRAFHAWCGRSPSEYRGTQQQF